MRNRPVEMEKDELETFDNGRTALRIVEEEQQGEREIVEPPLEPLEPVESSDQPSDQPTAQPYVNFMDDVFEDDTATTTTTSVPFATGQPISETHRLRREHATAGYRAGIVASKAESSQAGFDEGYTLGAALGAGGGVLLGMLEAIVEGLKTTIARAKENDERSEENERSEDKSERNEEKRENEWSEKRENERSEDKSEEKKKKIKTYEALAEKIDILFAKATRELDIQSIFSSTFFEPDGTWKYSLGDDEDDSEKTVEDVAAAHPLLRAWSKEVAALAEMFHLEIDHKTVAEGLGLGEVETEATETTETTTEPTTMTSSSITTTTTTTTQRNNVSDLDW